MSRHHNPLGISYNTEERKTIAALAAKYDVYIVEDDYMADLGVDHLVDPIYAYDQTEHTIYLKSFSKIIFPGLRLGVAVLPENLLKTFSTYKRYVDTSILSQAALDIYIKNGMYERHKHTISKLYSERVRILNKAVERYNQSGYIQTPAVTSGVYTQFKLPRTVNLERLVHSLNARSIQVVAGKGFYLSSYREQEKFLRISISRAQPDLIDKGVKSIIEEVSKGNWY